MKIRNKLLATLIPSAAIASVAIPMTACNPTADNGISYNGEKTFTITSAGKTINFTLDKELESSQSLKITIPKFDGDIPSPTIGTISGTTVPVLVKLSSSGSSHSAFNVKFTCYNAGSEVWSSTITGFDVTKTA